MELPEPLEIRPQFDQAGNVIGESLPSRKDQVEAFNRLLTFIRENATVDGGNALMAEVDRVITTSEVEIDCGQWPDGTGFTIVNQGEFGYTVHFHDSRFRTLTDARAFAELMRGLLAEPRNIES